MKKYLMFLIPCMLLFCGVVRAEDSVPLTEIPLEQFLSSAFAVVMSFFQKQPDGSDLAFALKLSGLITLLISTMKVSFMRPLWDKLGNWKWALSFVLSFAAALLGQGSSITLGSALLYLSAGPGALALHELIDKVKAIPGLNKYIGMAISLIELVLRKPGAEAPKT